MKPAPTRGRRPAPSRPTAVILTCERLMVPLLSDVLQHAGLRRIVSYHRASATTVRRAKPHVVVLDADRAGSTSLAVIRAVRAQTAARIVVLTRAEDRAWNAVARLFGADAVLGPQADRQDLLTAVASVVS